MKNSTTPRDSQSESALPGDAAANPHRPSGNLAARIYFGLVAMIGTAAIAAGMTVVTTNSGWASLVSVLGETVVWGDFLVAVVVPSPWVWNWHTVMHSPAVRSKRFFRLFALRHQQTSRFLT